MKALIEFLPIVLFFATYKLLGLMEATIVLMVSTALQTSLLWLRHRKLENSQILTLVAVLLFGGATLLFKNENFIKWKPTVVYWIMAAAFVGGRYWGSKKPLTERMLSKSIQLPQKIWSRLDWSWVVFFLMAGAINLFVAFHFSTDIWVDFKLFGLLGLTLLFALGQGAIIGKFMTQPIKSENTEEAKQ